jgi:hypothetical protein
VIKVVKKLDAIKVNNRADSNAAKVVKAASIAVNEIAKIISARRGEFALLDQTHLDLTVKAARYDAALED